MRQRASSERRVAFVKAAAGVTGNSESNNRPPTEVCQFCHAKNKRIWEHASMAWLLNMQGRRPHLLCVGLPCSPSPDEVWEVLRCALSSCPGLERRRLAPSDTPCAAGSVSGSSMRHALGTWLSNWLLPAEKCTWWFDSCNRRAATKEPASGARHENRTCCCTVAHLVQLQQYDGMATARPGG